MVREEEARPFGGRNAARGTGYESRVAAWFAVRMLAGRHGTIWDGLNGDFLESIAMQTPDPVDDVVIRLCGDSPGVLHVSAKDLTKAVCLTPNDKFFRGTIEGFAKQFHRTTRPGHASRLHLIWATPHSAGNRLTRDLKDALDQLRCTPDNISFAGFLGSRAGKHSKALRSVVDIASDWWNTNGSVPPLDPRKFLSCIHILPLDLDVEHPMERDSLDLACRHIVARPEDATECRDALIEHFRGRNEFGGCATRHSLTELLIAKGIRLQSSPDFASDIERLRAVSNQVLEQLSQHARLPFPPESGGDYHFARTGLLDAMMATLDGGNRVLTGEPGSGKSGLLFDLANRLESSGIPWLAFLAEDLAAPSHREGGADAVLGLGHDLDQILAQWPSSRPGFVLIDALDSLRDADEQKRLRQTLGLIIRGKSGWKVIASVREFDLHHSRDLADLFFGQPIPGHSSPRLPNIAHLHVTGPNDEELDQLIRDRPNIASWVISARRNRDLQGGDLLLPFHLRLVAELIADGLPSGFLDDAKSAGVLLAKYWEHRVESSPSRATLGRALDAICRAMVQDHRPAATVQTAGELTIGPAVSDLRRLGILAQPPAEFGVSRAVEVLRFSHHLLHDYAVSRYLVPKLPAELRTFLIENPDFAVYYPLSYGFALEEVWLAPSRSDYWNLLVRLAGPGRPGVRPTVRVQGPTVAVRRATQEEDIAPLTRHVCRTNGAESETVVRVLLDLAWALADAGEPAARRGATAWCRLTQVVSEQLSRGSAWERPCVRLLECLAPVEQHLAADQRLALNQAGRHLLDHHLSLPVREGWRMAVATACEIITKTASIAPEESEAALRGMISADRLAQFPDQDLWELISNLRHLGPSGYSLALDLFRIAFGPGPEQGRWVGNDSAVLSLQFQTSDQWAMLRELLAGYYEARADNAPEFLVDAACIALSAPRRRRRPSDSKPHPIVATCRFRGREVSLFADLACLRTNRESEPEPRIQIRLRDALRAWCRAEDVPILERAVDAFARSASGSAPWNLLMEAGSQFPTTLGRLLGDLLSEPALLTEPDYSFNATRLLAALHESGDGNHRRHLEGLLRDLPALAEERRLGHGYRPSTEPSRAQHRALGVLAPEHIVMPELRELRDHLAASDLLPAHLPPVQVPPQFLPDDSPEALRSRGADPESPLTREFLSWSAQLKALIPEADPTGSSPAEAIWTLVTQVQDFLDSNQCRGHPLLGELSDRLDEALHRLIDAAPWTAEDPRWLLIQKHFLDASASPEPQPVPRLEAARALPGLVARRHRCDEAVRVALGRLIEDPATSVRAWLVHSLPRMARANPALLWNLTDRCLDRERHLAVLEHLLYSLTKLSHEYPEEVRKRIESIEGVAITSDSEDHELFNRLGEFHLFDFLRTGAPPGWRRIETLLADCTSSRNHRVLAHLVFECQHNGCLTDRRRPDVRKRAWDFVRRTLDAARKYIDQPPASPPSLPSLDESRPPVGRKALELVDTIAGQIRQCCRVVKSRTQRQTDPDHQPVSPQVLWRHVASVLDVVVSSGHPHTLCSVLESLTVLLPEAPTEVFHLGAEAIHVGFRRVGSRLYQEPLAAESIVKFLRRTLADHREIFDSGPGPSAPREELLALLDFLTDSGWPIARPLVLHLDTLWR